MPLLGVLAPGYFDLGPNSHMVRMAHIFGEELYVAGRVNAFSSFHACSVQ